VTANQFPVRRALQRGPPNHTAWGHSCGKTVGIAGDTSVERVDALWGQNPSSAAVPNTTESHPHGGPHPKRAPDLGSRRFSTVSTGAKNTMESVERSQSTKRTARARSGGKPHSRRRLDEPVQACPRRPPEEPQGTTATRPRPKRHVRPDWRTTHLFRGRICLGTQPNQEAPSGEVSRRARRTGRVGGPGPRAACPSRPQRSDPCRAFWVEAEDGQITLSGFDYETSVRVTVPAAGRRTPASA